MLVIVLVLFYRLEGSRIGRAWAAIREDEVAAQASGVNTMRVKLLAFAIGASTSALGRFLLRDPGRLLRPQPVHAAGLDPHRRLRGVRRPGFAAGGDGRCGRAHLAAAVPQGPGAAGRPADVDRRTAARNDDLPTGRVVAGPSTQGRARGARLARLVRGRRPCPHRRGCEHDGRRRDRHPRGRLRRLACDAALRRSGQPQRREPADVPRRDPGRDRAERRGQDVAVQLAHRRLHTAGGSDHAGRAPR